MLSVLLILELLFNHYRYCPNIADPISGNVLRNPDPTDCNLKFFHSNLDSLTARDNSKMSLIETYNSVFNYDLIATSDTKLDRSISNEDIKMKGFSCDILRSDTRH